MTFVKRFALVSFTLAAVACGTDKKQDKQEAAPQPDPEIVGQLPKTLISKAPIGANGQPDMSKAEVREVSASSTENLNDPATADRLWNAAPAGAKPDNLDSSTGQWWYRHFGWNSFGFGGGYGYSRGYGYGGGGFGGGYGGYNQGYGQVGYGGGYNGPVINVNNYPYQYGSIGGCNYGGNYYGSYGYNGYGYNNGYNY